MTKTIEEIDRSIAARNAGIDSILKETGLTAVTSKNCPDWELEVIGVHSEGPAKVLELAGGYALVMNNSNQRKFTGQKSIRLHLVDIIWMDKTVKAVRII